MLKHYLILITTLLGSSHLALAADAPSPTKEAREKMAQAHVRLAACLRSERDFADCRREMMQSCKADMGEKGCKMGMMGDHGDHQEKPSSSTKAP